ncbi:hypothetical protein C2869_19370 [Saccharobesus litoralis]|uniref:Colicin import membrane protein n=1 Tax=Saccharobesus litoralis TaxID=2172099 RepID=A0A2S0VW35_9ALTE|nr:hypothetical protein [Saccharobesus litoralis]AWB68434.1 hypothetical protein C2869_19370 [Saccharobesus litoralis]
MTKTILKIGVLSAFLAASLNVQANENIDLDDVTMEVADKKMRHARSLGSPIREAVTEFMLEKGDITQEELEARKTEREADRAALKALKEAGDEDALAIKKEELKAKRDAQREQMKAYKEANADELQTVIEQAKQEAKQAREEAKEEREQRRQDMREKKKERKAQQQGE